MTKFERAAQLWPLLIFAAHNRQILTYALVGQLTGVPPIAVGKTLGPIQSYCKQHKLPGLTALVVHENDGLPGKGFTAAQLEQVFSEQARVFAFDWIRNAVPSPGELEDAHSRFSTAAR